MRQKQILVVDDELAITKVVAYYLKREGYGVEIAEDGYSTLKAVQTGCFDLIILDLMLPDLSGLEIARRLKADTCTAGIPIIMLTAKVEVDDILTGFKLKADDYITKPFSPAILTARVKSILRQIEPAADIVDHIYNFECGLIIFPDSLEIFVNSRKIELSQTEYELLMLLARHVDLALSRKEIVACLKSKNVAVTERGLDLVIMNLRKKMGTCGECIHTLRGYGYKFMEQNGVT